MGVARWTTPTFELVFEEEWLNFLQANSVYVSFESGNYSLNKTGSSLVLTARTIGVLLSQEETSRFQVGIAKVQANWLIGDKRYASEEMYFEMTDNMLKQVIE